MVVQKSTGWTYPFHGCDEEIVEGSQRGLVQGALASRERGSVFHWGHGVTEQTGHALTAPGIQQGRQNRRNETKGTCSLK